MKNFIKFIRNLSALVEQMLAKYKQQAINLEYERKNKIKTEAMNIVIDSMPFIILEWYDKAIYKYQVDHQKTHYHNQAVKDIRKILQSEIENRLNFRTYI